MQNRYKAVLFAPDGNWVTDYAAETVTDVWERVSDGGSRWFFYPYPFVITSHALTTPTQRIVSAPEGFEHLVGRTIRTAGRVIAEEGF